MKSLGAKFSEDQLKDIKNLAEKLGVSVSAVSRAALRMGAVSIEVAISRDAKKAKDVVLINDARAKQ